MEPITLQFSLSEGRAFVYFLQPTYHVQTHAFQKLSPILKLVILFFFTIVKNISAKTSLKIFIQEAWGNLPNADHSATPFSPTPLPLASPATHQHNHAHPPGLSALFN